VDFARNSVGDARRVPKGVWNLVAFGFGIAISYFSNLDIYPGHSASHIITGLALGASASGFHEVFDFFSSKAKAATSASLAPIELAEKHTEA
jgi:hypothetical protein